MSIEDEGSRKIATLIRSYGEYWNPEFVDWAASKELLGQGNEGPGSVVNIWEQRGVYVLYKEYIPVYVGKAFKQSIGKRLSLHRESWRKGPRWDSFSWFGLQRFKKDGNPSTLTTRANVSSGALIETLEALLIAVIDPRLNARRETLKGAVHIYQSKLRKPTDMEERLAGIEASLKSLRELIIKPKLND